MLAKEPTIGTGKKYNRHPAVFGYHLKDEPIGNQLSDLEKTAKVSK